jgi:hypothetical protein
MVGQTTAVGRWFVILFEWGQVRRGQPPILALWSPMTTGGPRAGVGLAATRGGHASFSGRLDNQIQRRSPIAR